MTRPTYPLEVINGTLSLTTSYPAKVAQAITQGVLTEAEERVLRPDYGRQVNPLDSAEIPTVLGQLRRAVAKALEGHPKVTFQLQGSFEDDGILGVLVSYQCQDSKVNEVYVRLPGMV